ncbi:MAG: SdpI family protein [Clostridia bacterium]|jgi:uncharacterized membrane protein|nr:SdpI family protein [Clostridia bacterium]
MLERLKKEWFIFAIILASFAFGLYVYPELPEQIPRHWNIRGEVDGWSGKTFGVLFFPLLNLALYPLFLLLPRLDPRRANYMHFSKAYTAIRVTLHLFFAVLYVISLLAALGYPLDINLIVKFIVSLLILILGNYMGKFKHNYFVGIKTPWTLANEEVWFKTHRFAAPLWVAAGLLGMALSFFHQAWAAYLMFGGIMAAAFIPMVYSYVIFRKLGQDK